MLERLLQFSIRQRWLVVIASMAVAALGLYNYTRLPIDDGPQRSHRATGGPPATAILLTVIAVANPTKRLSGDQNSGLNASSVPANGRAFAVSSACTQMRDRPSAPLAVNATWRPSGETAGPLVSVDCGGAGT